MTKRKIAALAALALLLPSLAFAAVRGTRGRQPHALAQRVVERLDLTPEQVRDIREILASYKPEITVELARIKETRGRLFSAIHAETINEAAIRNAATAVGQAEAELAMTRARIVQEVRQVLTPEQREEAQEMLADARAFVEDWLARLRERLTSDPLAGI